VRGGVRGLEWLVSNRLVLTHNTTDFEYFLITPAIWSFSGDIFNAEGDAVRCVFLVHLFFVFFGFKN